MSEEKKNLENNEIDDETLESVTGGAVKIECQCGKSWNIMHSMQFKCWCGTWYTYSSKRNTVTPEPLRWGRFGGVKESVKNSL